MRGRRRCGSLILSSFELNKAGHWGPHLSDRASKPKSANFARPKRCGLRESGDDRRRAGSDESGTAPKACSALQNASRKRAEPAATPSPATGEAARLHRSPELGESVSRRDVARSALECGARNEAPLSSEPSVIEKPGHFLIPKHCGLRESPSRSRVYRSCKTKLRCACSAVSPRSIINAREHVKQILVKISDHGAPLTASK